MPRAGAVCRLLVRLHVRVRVRRCGSDLVQVFIMSRCCCLCRQTVCTDHRRRKRLSGPSCSKAREVLTSLSGHTCVDIMLHNPDAVLCTSCDSTLSNIAEYEQKLTALKRDILGKVSNVMSQGQSSCSTRKRSISPTHSVSLPASKATCGGPPCSDTRAMPSNLLPGAQESVEPSTSATGTMSSPPLLPTHHSTDKAPLSSHQVELRLTSDGATNASSVEPTSSSSVGAGPQASPVIEVSLH